MAQPQTFGRRRARPQAPTRPPLAPHEGEEARLEAFRASLKDAPPAGEDHAFQAWLHEQRPRRWLLIVVRLAFLAPGLLCFVLHAPGWVSLALEGAGLFANAWIRTERKKQTAQIAGWSAGS